MGCGWEEGVGWFRESACLAGILAEGMEERNDRGRGDSRDTTSRYFYSSSES